MVKSESYVPDRGDVIWITLNPQAGHEQSGRRPALVLSPKAYNGKVNLAVMCPITNQTKGYPFEVAIPSDSAISGAILADRVKSLDWLVRKAELICKLPDNTVDATLQRLSILLTDK